MADFNLGGLLSGGGGLYDDLLTPQQRDQLSSRGLLSMAGAFADAAMPSRFPVPLGAAIGKAAAAMSGGRDEAALRLLQGQKLSQEVQTMKMTADLQKQFMKDLQSLPLSELVKRYGSGGASTAATTAAPTTSPLPVTPDTAPLPAAPDAPAAPMFAMPPIPSIYGNPPRQNLSPYTGLRPATPAAPPALLPMPPAPPGGRITPADYGAPNPPPDAGSTPTPDDPAAGASLDDRYRGVLALAGRLGGGASGSSLPPPDELIRQGSGPGGLLQASYTGAPPFGQIPGGGGDEVGSGGDTSSPEYLAKRARDLALTRKYESGDRNIMQNVVGPQGGYNPSVGRVTGPSSAGGYYQMIDSTWRSAAASAGIDTQQYPRAIDAPRELQQKAAEALYDKRGLADWAPYNRALARAVGWSGPMGDGGGSGGGAAPGASGAPTAAGGGDGQGMNTLLLELAKRNAMAEILKLGNPYSSMLSVLQGSPEYKGQIAGAEARATQPVTQENATHASQLKILEDMAKDNMTVDANGKIVLLPEAQRIRTMNAEQQAEAKAKWDAPVEQPVYSPDGTIKIEKMNTFEFRRREADKARRAALGDTMPRPGDLAQTPYYRPGQAEQETDIAKAKLAPTTKIAEQLAADYTELRRQAIASQRSIANTQDLRSKLDSGMFTGLDANWNLFAAKLGETLGWTNLSNPDKVKNTEVYIARLGEETANLIKSMKLGPPTSDQDVRFAERIAGGQNLSANSIRELLDLREKYARLAIEQHNEQAKTIAPEAFRGFQRDIALPPPYQQKAGTTPSGLNWSDPGR